MTVPAAIADPTVGAPAPEFTLPSTAGEVALASFRGKHHVLLAFFPLAFTSTCTAENCAFSEDYARFDDRHAAPDSAIGAALTTYYDRMSRRDWRAYRASFWPRGTISTRWRAPGDSAPTVHVQTIDQFIAATKDGPDRLAVFEERMVDHDIMGYGDLALVWATFRARFGMPGVPAATHYGVDCFQWVEDHGAWRIVSLAFTQELPGDSLPKDF